MVGRKFGAYVTHETKNFAYFYIGQTGFLVFKTVCSLTPSPIDLYLLILPSVVELLIRVVAFRLPLFLPFVLRFVLLHLLALPVLFFNVLRLHCHVPLLHIWYCLLVGPLLHRARLIYIEFVLYI